MSSTKQKIERKSKLAATIRGYDIYGQEITFNLGKNFGECYTTVFGGILGIVTYVLTIGYICNQLYLMLTKSNDSVNNIRTYRNLEEAGRTYMNQTNMLNFFYVNKQNDQNWRYDHLTDEYIKIEII